MTNIYLIRHGQASFGAENYDKLSPLGEKQAKLLGQHLTKRVVDVDVGIRGSMFRHQQTAELASPLVKIEVDSDWNEYNHQDILAQYNPAFRSLAQMQKFISAQKDPNQTFRHIIHQAFSRWMNNETAHEYQESWTDYQVRINRAVDKIQTRYPAANNILVFTSGGPISLVSQQLLSTPIEKLIELNWTLVNCGVTKLIRRSSGLYLSSLNEHSIFDGADNALLTYK